MDLTKTSPFSDNFHLPPALLSWRRRWRKMSGYSFRASWEAGMMETLFCQGLEWEMALECLLMTSGGARMGVVQPSWFPVIPRQLLVPLSVLYRW